MTAEPVIAYLVTGNAARPRETQLLSENSGTAAVLGTFVPLMGDEGQGEAMEEFCAYCGEEVVGEGVHANDAVFCSQECLDAFSEEELLFMDEEERDDL